MDTRAVGKALVLSGPMRVEAITLHEYSMHLMMYQLLHQDMAWGLTEEPEGQPYYFRAFDAYACIGPFEGMPTVASVQGVFKFSKKPGVANEITELCKRLGYAVVALDCFLPVAKAWMRAGFLSYKELAFDPEFAPAAWKPEYGTPEVLYMRKYIGDTHA